MKFHIFCSGEGECERCRERDSESSWDGVSEMGDGRKNKGPRHDERIEGQTETAG